MLVELLPLSNTFCAISLCPFALLGIRFDPSTAPVRVSVCWNREPLDAHKHSVNKISITRSAWAWYHSTTSSAIARYFLYSWCSCTSGRSLCECQGNCATGNSQVFFSTLQWILPSSSTRIGIEKVRLQPTHPHSYHIHTAYIHHCVCVAVKENYLYILFISYRRNGGDSAEKNVNNKNWIFSMLCVCLCLLINELRWQTHTENKKSSQ